MTNFNPQIQPLEQAHDDGLFFVFNKGQLLIKVQNDIVSIPNAKDVSRIGVALVRRQYIGTYGVLSCIAAEADTEAVPAEEGYAFKALRSLFASLSEDLIWIAGRANQLVDWQRTHLFCGACGHLNDDKKDERAKICPSCGLVNYPRLSPAVIVAVFKENKILLARNKGFKIPMYSVLAGFVEPSETLEQCVQREIKEEVGIDVENIQYFGSQPWPFPNSLMIAFTAEYAGGEITLEPSEIVDAAWFSKDNLPQIPPTISIAGKLIDWFCRNRSDAGESKVV